MGGGVGGGGRVAVEPLSWFTSLQLGVDTASRASRPAFTRTKLGDGERGGVERPAGGSAGTGAPVRPSAAVEAAMARLREAPMWGGDDDCGNFSGGAVGGGPGFGGLPAFPSTGVAFGGGGGDERGGFGSVEGHGRAPEMIDNRNDMMGD